MRELSAQEIDNFPEFLEDFGRILEAGTTHSDKLTVSGSAPNFGQKKPAISGGLRRRPSAKLRAKQRGEPGR